MTQSPVLKNGLNALLTPEESVLVLIDHQPFQFANLHSHEPTMIVNNVVALAKTAKVFNVPTILTTVLEDRGGKLIKGAAGRIPRAEADRPHLHQHLGGHARRRRGEEDRPQEDHHGGALVGNLPRHAGDPGCGRRLRGLRRHRCVRRRERRSARDGRPPHGDGRRRSDHVDGGRGRVAARLGPRGNGPRWPRCSLEHGGGTGIALAWELQLLGQKAGAGA